MIAWIERGPRLSATGASNMKKGGPLSGLRSTAGFPIFFTQAFFYFRYRTPTA
jgi:hypothetical protein